MFINNFKHILKTRKTSRSSSILVKSSIQTQGSSKLLSSSLNTKSRTNVDRTRVFNAINSVFFIKQKKTQLTMSLGPIAKKKKSMITLGFKSKTYSTLCSLFHDKSLPRLQGLNPPRTLLKSNGKVVSQSSTIAIKYVLLV